MNELSSDDDRLGELADEFLERYRRGERPALSEFARRHPDLAEQVRELFPALVTLEDARPDDATPTARATSTPAPGEALPEQLGEYRIVRRIGRGGMGVVYEAEQESLGRRVALKVLPRESVRNPRQIERFRREARAAGRLHHTNIVPVFGVGQDGEILFYVMQYIEGRPLDVVLDELRHIRNETEARRRSSRDSLEPRDRWWGSRSKRRTSDADSTPGPASAPVPVPASASKSTDSKYVARSLWEGRFHSESRASRSGSRTLGQGDESSAAPDPALGGIATAPGEWGDASTVGSEGSSSSALANPRQPYPWSVAHIGVQVAEALEHAEGLGILHRDVKPANLLLDVSGTVWLTDFGLAKTSEIDDLTRTGDLLGTLRYLAPERFQGQADVRADIYALGLTLYEMLALRPAFADFGEDGLVRQITTGVPAPLACIDPDLPRDLVTIIHKAIARDPGDRYQTPGALAEDLRRFLEDRPIVARQFGVVERGWRWCRRNPGMAATAGAATLALAAAALLALLYANSQAKATAKITGLAHQISRSLHDSNHRLAVLDLERGQLACERGEIDRGLLLMLESLRAATAVNDPRLRTAARANLSAWSRYTPRLNGVFSHGGTVAQVGFTPDGRTIVTAGDDGRIQFRDAAAGRLQGAALAHPGVIRTLLFNRNGARLLTQGRDGSVRVWNRAAGQPAGPLVQDQGFIDAVALSPDGARFAVAADDRTAQLWDAATGRLVGPPLLHPSLVRAVAFSPDGKLLLTGGQDGAARLWDLAAGQLVQTWSRHREPLCVVAFSPDGRTALTAGQDSTAQLWNTATGQPLGLPLRHQNWIETAVFSPDGSTVLTGSQDSTARLWDARTSDPVCLPLLHQGPVRTVAFSPDGRAALTGSQDGAARLWDAATGRPLGPSLHHQGPIETVAFSPDGRFVLTGSQDRTARLWNVAVQEPAGLPLQHQNVVAALAFSPDGRRVLTGGHDGSAQFWNADDGRPQGPPLRHAGAVVALAFSPDGARILTGTRDGVVQLWDAAADPVQPLGPPLYHQAAVRALAFSPDGRTLLTGSQDRTVRFWDAESGRLLTPPHYHQGPVAAVAFSPDGQNALTASDDATARLWDVATGQPQGQPLLHQRGVLAVAFSPDGKLVLTGSDDTTARLWNASTAHPVGPPLRHQAGVRAVAFSPDGKLVLTGSDDATARLWNTETSQPVGPPLRHEGLVRSVAFSPDGSRIATGSSDGTARLWDVATGRLIGPPLRHQQWVELVAFSPDGSSLLTGGRDDTARLWRFHERPEDLERLAALVRVLTGLEIDGQGTLRHLDEAAWRQEYERFHADADADSTRSADADRGFDPVLFGPDPTARARSWLERRQTDKADAAFREVLAARPANASIRLARAQFLLTLKQRGDEADAELVQAFLLGSRAPELTTELHQRDRAFRRLVALQPDAALDHWRKRGEYFLQQRQWDRAVSIYNEALESAPADPWLLLGRGRAFLALGRPEPARADFARAEPPASAQPSEFRDLIGEFARQSLWEKTARACNRLLEIDPTDHDTWYFSTPLSLQLDDLPGYQRHCARMLERFGTAADTAIAERTAKACLLAPLPESDLEKARQLADRAVASAEAHRLSVLPFCRLARALAEYRAGRFEHALAEAEWCLAQPSKPWNRDIPAGLVRSMAHARLQNHRLARASFDEASALLKARAANQDLRTGWHDWLICVQLQREAQGLIPDAALPPPTTPPASTAPVAHSR